ncbi:MAG: energy transducer TonB [bacterium]
MTDLFRRILARTTIGHIVAVVLFLTMPFITRLVAREQPVQDIMFVDLMSPMASIPLSALEPDIPEQKEEQPEEKAKEPEPEPEPKDLIQIPDKKVADKKKEPTKIAVSTTRVTRAKSQASSKSKKPPLTQAEIRKLLASGIPLGNGGGPGTGSAGGEVSALSWYYALVEATMYEVWEQPSGLSSAGPPPQVRIRVQRDGTITSRELVRRSGNSLMDDSVMKAVNSISRLKALPSEVDGSYKDITITFELTSPL